MILTYTVKMLYRQDDGKFEKEYLKKSEKLAKMKVSFFREETLKGNDVRIMNIKLYFIFSLIFILFSFYFLFLRSGVSISMT